jgi:hypothetical protein
LREKDLQRRLQDAIELLHGKFRIFSIVWCTRSCILLTYDCCNVVTA